MFQIYANHSSDETFHRTEPSLASSNTHLCLASEPYRMQSMRVSFAANSLFIWILPAALCNKQHEHVPE